MKRKATKKKGMSGFAWTVAIVSIVAGLYVLSGFFPIFRYEHTHVSAELLVFGEPVKLEGLLSCEREPLGLSLGNPYQTLGAATLARKVGEGAVVVAPHAGCGSAASNLRGDRYLPAVMWLNSPDDPDAIDVYFPNKNNKQTDSRISVTKFSVISRFGSPILPFYNSAWLLGDSDNLTWIESESKQVFFGLLVTKATVSELRLCDSLDGNVIDFLSQLEQTGEPQQILLKDLPKRVADGLWGALDNSIASRNPNSPYARKCAKGVEDFGVSVRDGQIIYDHESLNSVYVRLNHVKSTAINNNIEIMIGKEPAFSILRHNVNSIIYVPSENSIIKFYEVRLTKSKRRLSFLGG